MRKAKLVPLLFVCLMFTALQGCAAFAPAQPKNVRVGSLKDGLRETLSVLSNLREAHLITDTQQDEIAVYREQAVAAIDVLATVNDFSSPLAREQLDKYQAALDKLAGIRNKAILKPTDSGPQLRTRDSVAEDTPEKPMTAGGEASVIYMVGSIILGALKYFQDKSEQARREGRDLTPEEVSEIDTQLDLEVARSRALDAPQDGPKP